MSQNASANMAETQTNTEAASVAGENQSTSFASDAQEQTNQQAISGGDKWFNTPEVVAALEELGGTEGFTKAMAIVKEHKAPLAKDAPPAYDFEKMGFSGVGEELAKDYHSHAIELGLTPEQAENDLKWRLEYSQKKQQEQFEQGMAALKTQWGNKYDENTKRSLDALMALDKRMGGDLVESLKTSGLANSPAIVRALFEISNLISEDSLGGANNRPNAGQREMTTEEYVESVFKGE